MSTIKTSTLSNTEGTKELAVNDLIDRACCRAWVNFDGTNPSIKRGSFNVNSIEHIATGLWKINFNPMPDTNYVCLGMVRGFDSSDNSAEDVIESFNYTRTTTSVWIACSYANTFFNSTIVQIAIFR